MSGEMSQKERIVAAYEITRVAVSVDSDIIRKVEAVLYIMADKFLDSVEMEQLKEEIKMTRLGQMLYSDGFTEGRVQGEACGEMKLSKLITILLKENMTKDIEVVTSDKNARERYYAKYDIK